MQLLVDGKLKLYLNPRCKLRDPTYNEALMVGDKNYRFIHNHDFYIKKKGNRTKKFKNPKSNNIPDIFEPHQSKIKSHLVKHQFKLNNKKDLIKLFRYYNKL